MNKHKQFIKECYDGKHGSMCNNWKELILKSYPEFNKIPRLEVGKWYKNPWNHLINLTKLSEGRVDFYGFYTNGWTDSNFADITSWIEKLTPATDQEVESALIKEAKKRGLWDNENVKCLLFGDKNTAKGLHPCYENNDLWSKYGKIFSNGNWTTITETITKEEAEKQLGKTII